MDLNKITDLNSFYNNNVKKGYNVSDREEFKIVRKTLIDNNLPLSNFYNNLLTLIIAKGDSSFSPTYDKKRNQINNDTHGEDFIHELFHMASRKNEHEMGCLIELNGQTIGISLNEGITDYLTYLSLDGNYKIKYVLESIIVKYLINIFGNNLLKKHFSADAKDFYNVFKEYRDDLMDYLFVLDEFTKREHMMSDINFSIGTGNLDGLKYNPQEYADSFYEAITGFMDFLESIEIDYCEKFISEIKSLFERDEKIISTIELSSYKSINEMINGIKNDFGIGGNDEPKQ